MKSRQIIFQLAIKSLLILSVVCLSRPGSAQDADLNVRRLAGDLATAAMRSDLDDAKALLAQGAPANGMPGYSTPLMAAAQAGFGSYCGEKRTPPVGAKQYIEIVTLLLNNGADVNARETYFSTNGTALMEAASSGVVEIVELLLDRGAEVNAKDSQGTTALMIAARYHSVEVVRLLLKHSAQVNAVNNEGYTPLMAASLGYAAVVELLLSEGAEVNRATKNGATALMLAADAERYGPWEGAIREVITNYNEKSKIMNLLLSKGAKVNAQTKTGTTALLRATHKGATDAVQLLLANGANPNLADKRHGTPVQLAVKLRDKWMKMNRDYLKWIKNPPERNKNGQWADQELQAHRVLVFLEQAVVKRRKQPHNQSLQPTLRSFARASLRCCGRLNSNVLPSRDTFPAL